MNFDDFEIKPDSWSCRVIDREFREKVKNHERLQAIVAKDEIDISDFFEATAALISTRSEYLSYKLSESIRFKELYEHMNRFEFGPFDKVKSDVAFSVDPIYKDYLSILSNKLLKFHTK